MGEPKSNYNHEDVLAHQDKPWEWDWLSKNPSITIKDVDAHPDAPWNWGSLSQNPSITMKDIESRPNKPWNWYLLSTNLFVYSPDLQIITIKKMRIIRFKHRHKIQSKILYDQ